MCRRAYWPRLVLAAALFAALAAPAFAQQPELDALAAKVAERILAKKKHVVVIADFSPDKLGTYPFGRAVTKEFVAALRRAAPSLQCVDRDTLASGPQKLNLQPIDLGFPDIAFVVAAASGAEVGLRGKIKKEKQGLKLEVYLSDLKAPTDPLSSQLGQQIGKLKSQIPVSPEWKELLNGPAEEQLNGIYRTGPFLDTSYAECVKCIDPSFTADARANKTQGIVLIVLTVNANGDPQDLLVLRHPGHGLAQAALEAVRHWKFKPARLRDGTAVPSRVMIEVKFRLI